MNKALAVAAVLLVVVLGGAALLYERLFGSGDDARAGTGAATTSGQGGEVAAATTLVDAGVVPVTDAGQVAVRRQATVVTADGFVEVREKGAAVWKKLTPGETVDDDDSVRTGRSGEARLRLSDGVEVRLSPRSEFTIRELAAGASRVRLEAGHVSANVDATKNEVLRVEAKGSDAVAETRGGEFGMVTDGNGQVAVATTTGSVKLTAKGKSVDVEAGSASTVLAGAEPSAPVAMPSSLLLKVADPVRRTTNTTTTVVEGTTAPGALVQAQDKLVMADKAGRFKVPVKLEDGVNKIGVTVVDAVGRQRDVALPEIVLDRTKPKIDAQMTWGED